MRVAREGTKMLENAIEQLSQKKTTKVGWFETAKYPDGTSVAYVAQILELGYAPKNIPPFAMLRQTIDMNEEEWSKFFNGVATKIIQGRMTLNQAMEALGLLVAGDVRKTISQITSPALKETTLELRRRRGNTSTKPLVDSGLMLATVTSLVEG